MDELPQLWNVIKGDMSLIGPRAEGTSASREYEEKIPFYHFRHTVKPGITGWAQVNYPYGENEVDAEEKTKIRPVLHKAFLVRTGPVNMPKNNLCNVVCQRQVTFL